MIIIISNLEAGYRVAELFCVLTSWIPVLYFDITSSSSTLSPNSDYLLYSISEVKLTFEISTVLRQQHSFSAHERVFLWKCQSFETENGSTWGGIGPPTFEFIPNALTILAIRARNLPSYVFFQNWFWWYRYFWSKVNFWNVNCVRATASICESFWDRKCFDRRGTRTPNLRIQAECSNHLRYQGQTFAVLCLWILALAI